MQERIDVNKTSESKEYEICHYWYFLNKGFKFQPNVSNIWDDLMMISMNLSDIAILNIKSNVMQNFDLTKKLEHYKI